MKNYGLKLGRGSEKDYYLGTLPRTVINPLRDWTDYLPTYEPQILPSGEDLSGCFIYGTLNALETLMNKVYPKIEDEWNFSERYPYNGMNANMSGGDPFEACEWIRKNGLINEPDMPVVSPYSAYCAPRPLPKELLDKGKTFLTKYNIRQEYLWNDFRDYCPVKDKIITECLQYGPIGVSLFAWAKDENGLYYRPFGQPDTHWCILYKETDTHYCVFDTYDQSHKKVRKDMNFAIAIRYDIHTLSKPSLWDKIIAWIRNLYKI